MSKILPKFTVRPALTLQLVVIWCTPEIIPPNVDASSMDVGWCRYSSVVIYPESYACKKSGRTVGKQAIFGLPIGSIGCMVYLLTNLLRQLPANFQIAWILYLKANHVMVFFTNQSFGRISRITPDFQHYTHYTGDTWGTCRCPLDPVLLVGSVPVAGVFFLSFFFVSSMSASFFSTSTTSFKEKASNGKRLSSTKQVACR